MVARRKLDLDLIPFLVVASAFAPGESDVSDRIVERFSLDGDAARSVHALFNDKAESRAPSPGSAS